MKLPHNESERDPCPRCGVRPDFGCAHRPKVELPPLPEIVEEEDKRKSEFTDHSPISTRRRRAAQAKKWSL